MLIRFSKTDRSGISLTEILIGIMVLGIGVISLATLFPLGLLRMMRAVNSVRGTVTAENAWHETQAWNLLAPPFGPPANYFSRYPAVAAPWPNNFWQSSVPAITGSGLPVVIDPLWMIQNPTRTDRHRFGMTDMDNNSLPDAAIPYGEGLLRTPGWFGPGADGAPGVVSVDDDGNGIIDDVGELGWPGSDDVVGFTFLEASELFASPDDMTFGEGENKRMVPLQDLISPTPGAPPYLTPTNGVPFGPGSLLRESRYSWIIIARKVNARQGITYTYGVGADGVPGTNNGGPFGNGDDDGNGIIDDVSELGWPGSDDVLLVRTLSDYGPNELTGPLGSVPTADDPARDRMTGLPVPGPRGPFDVTIVVFYNRDYSSREAVYANTLVVTPPLPVPIFTAGSDLATLYLRADGVPFPEIPIGSYIMDTSLDSRPITVVGATGLRNSFVYRVTGKALDATGNIMTLTLDQKARATGQVLTVLKGAVGVFEKEVP